MKKDDKILLIVIAIILFTVFPGLFIMGILGYLFYIKYKDKYKLNEKINKATTKYKDKKKTNNYEVIDTTAEIIDSKIIQEDEWTATKEYKH